MSQRTETPSRLQESTDFFFRKMFIDRLIFLDITYIFLVQNLSSYAKKIKAETLISQIINKPLLTFH